MSDTRASMTGVATLLTGADDPERLIAIANGKAVTLAQLRRDVATNAKRLAATGCRRGLLVAVDTYWAAVGILSLFQAGAEVVLPQNVTAGGLAAIREYWDLLVCDRLPIGQSDGQLDTFMLAEGADSDWTLQGIDTAACRLNLFTSGSTGIPKSVPKTLAVMEREAAAIEAIVGRDVPKHARVFGTVTHQHMFGLTYKLFWPLCSGRCIHSTSYELWESLLGQDLKDAVIVTSPAHLTRLAPQDSLPVGQRPLAIFSAGAFLPLSASTMAAKILGKAICEIYGSTETGTIAWRERADIELPWRPIPDVSVSRGPDGEILVRSPFLPDESVFVGNDIVDIVEDGGFRLRGRTDRIAKIDGKRVSLAEVEAQLGALPLVSAASVLVLPGAQEVLAAVVVPTDLGRREMDRVGSFRFGRLLRLELARTQEAAGRPRRWRFVDTLPRSDMGKILQQNLLNLFTSECLPTEPDLRALRRDGDTVELDLYNRSDLRQLDGHFPNMPIIPGVAQIDWAVKLAARYLGLAVEAATDFQVKFHRLTLPDTLVTLELTHDAARRRLNFTYRQGTQVLTSGIVRMPAS